MRRARGVGPPFRILRRFTQGYDLFGHQLMTPGKLLFESVRRFKGQQAPAIVLVDIDPVQDRWEAFQRLLYSGMTRATVRLELLVKADNPLNRPFTDLASAGSGA